MNWTCNCSLYNTIVLVVAFGTLVAGRSATRTRFGTLVAGRSATRTWFGKLVAGHSATRTLDGIRGNKQCSGRIRIVNLNFFGRENVLYGQF